MRLRKHTMVAFGCFALLSAAMSTAPTAAQESSDADPFGNGPAVNPVSTSAPVDQERAPQDRTATPSSLMLDEQTRQRLKQPLTLEYDEEVWSDIKADLESKLGVNILLDHSASDDSLSEDELITFQVRDVPGDYALRLMLRDWNATYFVQAGVIRIISLDDAQTEPGFFVRKVFDVDDLLASIKRWNQLHRNEAKKPNNAADPKPPTPENSDASHSFGDTPGVFARASAIAGQFGSGIVHRRSGDSSAASRLTPATEQLLELIYQSVHEDQWLNRGNGLATISLVCGHLVVFGPETLVSELDDLLSDLRAKIVSD